MRPTIVPSVRTASLTLAALLVICSCIGCVGLLANVMHATRGNLVPAEFPGLEKRRVAVVCVSNSASFGPTRASTQLARQVGFLLAKNVRGIQLVDPQQIADWIDQHDWDYTDYAAIGRGVDAQMVLAIDLDGFSLHDGQTLYKGRANVDLTVYDMTQGGKQVFAVSPPQIEYPRNAGYHTTDISEQDFRRKFLGVVAVHIARYFYAYELKDDFAQDATLVGAS